MNQDDIFCFISEIDDEIELIESERDHYNDEIIIFNERLSDLFNRKSELLDSLEDEHGF